MCIINLTKYAKCFFLSDHTICVPTSSVHVIIILQLCHYFIYQTLKCCPIAIYEMISLQSFYLPFLWSVRLSIYIIGYLSSFFCKVPVKLFVYLSFRFVSYWFVGVLYVDCLLIPVAYMYHKNYLPVCVCF